MVGEGRLGCSGHKERGSCSNSKKISAARVEDAVLEGLRARMLHPELIREFTKTFSETLAHLLKANLETGETQAKRLTEIDKQISRIIDSMEVAGPFPSLVRRPRELELSHRQVIAGPQTKLKRPNRALDAPGPA
jgi:site-specific DNA recombinase